jgi:MFS family permease
MTSTVNQFYATFCANLLCLSYGLATAWTSAAIPLLKSNETPLKSGKISTDEADLIGSVLTVGGLFGTFVFGFASSRIGSKKSIFLMAFPQIFGWILMYYAENVLSLIIFRLLAGFSAGGVLTVISSFITEISIDR